MRRRQLPFFCRTSRLDGDLYLPDDGDGPFPVIVPASGYQGLKVIHPERFARALTARGFAVFAFDYAGFGASEGERGRLAPQEWVENLRCAVDVVCTVSEVDTERIGLLGWGLGGGVVVAEAAEDARVRAVVSMNGVGDGARATRAMHDEQTWASLVDRIAADRARRVTLGRSEVTSPWDIVRLDLDAQTDDYVRDELYRAPGFGSGVTLESAEALLRFHPETVAAQLSPRPYLVIHGSANGLHPLTEGQSLYDHAAEPKQLLVLPGHGHTEWMFDDHPTFASVIERLDEFFAGAFAAELQTV